MSAQTPGTEVPDEPIPPVAVCLHERFIVRERVADKPIYACTACGVLGYYRHDGFGRKQKLASIYQCGTCGAPATRRLHGTTGGVRMTFRCPSCP